MGVREEAIDEYVAILTKEDRMRGWLVGFMLVFAVGCSHGLQEVGFSIPDAKDGDHYIVNRDLANSRAWVNQTQLNGDLHCTYKRSSEEMAELRRVKGPDQTWYTGCTPLAQWKQHQYVKYQTPGLANFWGEVGKTAMISGAIAYTGHQIGKGLGRSGDNVTQSGSGNSESNSDADAQSDSDANASHQQNVGNKTTNIKPSTNINSNNVIKTK